MLKKIRQKLQKSDNSTGEAQPFLFVQQPPVHIALELADISLSVSGRNVKEAVELFGMLLLHEKVQKAVGEPKPFEESAYSSKEE